MCFGIKILIAARIREFAKNSRTLLEAGRLYEGMMGLAASMLIRKTHAADQLRIDGYNHCT
jgi:hypothetical protein